MKFRISLFLGNTLYAVALGYYTIICFLGYNGMSCLPLQIYNSSVYRHGFQEPWLIGRIALPFLHHTELLLSPTFVYAILWFASLFGFNIPKHIGPLLVIGAR